MKAKLALVAVHCTLALCVLAGCGGGGTDSGVTPPVPAAPAASDALQPLPAASKSVVSARAMSGATSPAADEHSLQVQIDGLKLQVAAIQRQLAQVVQTGVLSDTVREVQADETSRVEAEQIVATDIQTGEARFRGEVIDSAWSQNTVRGLRSELSLEDGSSTHLQSVECRSRTCRVLIDTAAAEAAGQDLPVAFARLGQILPNAMLGRMNVGDGRGLTVVYAWR